MCYYYFTNRKPHNTIEDAACNKHALQTTVEACEHHPAGVASPVSMANAPMHASTPTAVATDQQNLEVRLQFRATMENILPKNERPVYHTACKDEYRP